MEDHQPSELCIKILSPTLWFFGITDDMVTMPTSWNNVSMTTQMMSSKRVLFFQLSPWDSSHMQWTLSSTVKWCLTMPVHPLQPQLLRPDQSDSNLVGWIYSILWNYNVIQCQSHWSTEYPCDLEELTQLLTYPIYSQKFWKWGKDNLFIKILHIYAFSCRYTKVLNFFFSILRMKSESVSGIPKTISRLNDPLERSPDSKTLLNSHLWFIITKGID